MKKEKKTEIIENDDVIVESAPAADVVIDNSGDTSEGKAFDINVLIEKGKAHGSVSHAEIMEALDETDYDPEHIEKIYDILDSHGIEVPDKMSVSDVEEIENEVEQLNSAEDMEKMLTQEGLSIDEIAAVRAAFAVAQKDLTDENLKAFEEIKNLVNAVNTSAATTERVVL